MERTVEITNRAGIHVRPAAKIAEISNKYKSEIVFVKDNVEINAKSIMDVLTLMAGQGAKIVIRAEGPDAEQALNELEALIISKFNED